MREVTAEDIKNIMYDYGEGFCDLPDCDHYRISLAFFLWKR